uniref:Elongator complex protein 4 n=1 Tax=Setaria digitata TaxID=48799 RepID=A0A915PX11_9BILA
MMAGVRLDAVPRISGTTVRSRYPEISVGCAAVDTLIGGGIPLSSVYIIDENKSRAYAPVLSKYFIAEGICCHHSLFVASTSRNPREFLDNLPDRVNDPQENPLRSDALETEDSTMKIAWRYSTVPKVNSSLSGPRNGSSQYDLMKKMDFKKIDACEISFFPNKIQPQDDLPSYGDLYKQISRKLMEDEFLATSSKLTKRVLRIIIEGVGSPFWQDPENDMKFIAHLRSILCSCYAVAVVIINSNGLRDERKERLYAYGDLVVHLDAVDCDNTTRKFGDRFNGYFRLLKLPAVSSIATHCPPSSDLVFQLQKRKFDIRILHLPPTLDNDNDKKGCDSNCQRELNVF